MENRTIYLKSRPKGEPTSENFEIAASAIPTVRPGTLLYRTLFLSVDPYLRGRMNEGKSYIPPFAIGAPIDSRFVGEVIESKMQEFPKGTIVAGMGPWSHFALSGGEGLSKIPNGVPPSSVLGVLGMPGLTAYVGLLDIGKPKAGETVVVSAAAGAVGSAVIQLAKLRGCRAIGIAGGKEKCSYVVNDLGADACIDHRADNIPEELRRHCPNGIDVYFDNVGGETLKAALANLRDHARIPLCGMISQYNAEKVPPGPSLFPLLVHKALIQGFIVTDHWNRIPELYRELAPLVQSGRFKYREDILKGLENAPEALQRVLRGQNFGKQLVQVAEL